MPIALALSLLSACVNQDAMTGHTRDVMSIAVSKDGKTVASGSTDRTVRLWDASTKACTGVIEGHDGDVLAVAFSPDGKTLATGEMYKKVRLFDVATRTLKVTLDGLEGRVNGVAFSADGQTVFAACQDNTVWALPAGGGSGKSVHHDYEVLALAVSPDGTLLATADGNGTVKVWDSKTLAQKGTVQQGDKAKAVAFSPDGSFLVTGGNESPLRMWKVGAWTEEASFKSPAIEANGIAFSPKGDVIVVAGQDNTVTFLNAKTGAAISKFEKHDRPVTGVAVGPNGQVFTSSMDMTVRSWTTPGAADKSPQN